MAREVHNRDIAPVLAAAEQWKNTCLVEDRSLFSTEFLWTRQIVDEVYQAFVKHPDYGEDDFMTKLKMANASSSAKRLMAEMLWALLVFPSNMKARTKALQVRTLWTMSGEELSSNSSLMKDDVLAGVGSGGPGFNNYRPSELAFLIELTRDLKEKSIPERRRILTNYEVFIEWIDTIPRAGSRQYRQMLRIISASQTASNGFLQTMIAGKFSALSALPPCQKHGTGPIDNSTTRSLNYAVPACW